MGITPLMFTGVSKYSSDLQSILNRSVAIASLPLQALQLSQQKEQDRKSALTALQPILQQFSNTVDSLADLSGSSGLSAASNSSLVNASNLGTAVPGVHIIENITQLAQEATAATVSTYGTADATPVAGAGNYLELWVGGERETLTVAPGQDNLEAIRDWINSSGLDVTASIVNTDSGYLLSVSANSTGAQTIELYKQADKGGTDLLHSISEGRDLQFDIDGQTVQRSSNTVTDVVPGLRLDFADVTGVDEQVRISTARSPQSMKNALQTLVYQYNALQTELAKHTGKAGGALTGDTVLGEVRYALSPLGSVSALADAGVSFDENGVLQFDSAAIDGLDNAGFQSLAAQLGDTVTGLAQFHDQWQSLTDPVTGSIATQLGQIETTNQRLSTQISDMNTRINSLQQNLLSRLQQADALLSQLESQQGMLDASLQSLTYVSYGYQKNPNGS